VSRRHAALVADERRVRIQDLGSTSGVFVNGEQVTQRVLEMGDVIRLGETTMEFFSLRDAGSVPG
jgi:pSer/pThr/pTyr-binding forkhead associated (FHA) protein